MFSVVHKQLLQCCLICEGSSLYLWVGELQSGDREDHLSSSDKEILRNLPGHVDDVRLDVNHWLDAACALQETDRYQDVWPQSKKVTFKLYYVIQNVFVSYIWSKCESWRDDQSVRAAEAQCLSVDTLLSVIAPDMEVCTDITRKKTSQNKETSLV